MENPAEDIGQRDRLQGQRDGPVKSFACAYVNLLNGVSYLGRNVLDRGSLISRFVIGLGPLDLESLVRVAPSHREVTSPVESPIRPRKQDGGHRAEVESQQNPFASLGRRRSFENVATNDLPSVARR